MSDKFQSLRAQSIKLIIAGFIFLIPGPLLFLLLIPLSLISRVVVRLIASIFRPDLLGFFNGKGLIFSLDPLHSKPKFTVGVHVIVDGWISVDKLRQLFQQRILNDRKENGNLQYPQLQQTWAQFFSFVFWKWDKEFDLRHHIRDYDYQDEGLLIPGICTEDDLMRIGSNLISQPFVNGRSPWEILVISKYRSKKNTTDEPQSVLTFRLHHALADGFSLMNLMFKFFELANVKVPLPTFPACSHFQKIFNLILMLLRMPYELVSQFLETSDGRNSWHVLEKDLSWTYHGFYSDRIPVNKIKEIKNKYRVGYNTTAYAITIGAIRRLMLEAGLEVPKKLSFAFPIPLPFRPSGGLVNHAGFFNASCSGRAGSPVEQLIEIAQKLEVQADVSRVAAVMSLAVDLILILPVFAWKLVHDKFMVTIAMSSFAGPVDEIEVNLDGIKEAPDMIPFVGPIPGRKIDAVALLLSMAGLQRIVLHVDKEIFTNHPVPATFAQHVNDEIHALLNADL